MALNRYLKPYLVDSSSLFTVTRWQEMNDKMYLRNTAVKDNGNLAYGDQIV